MKNGWKALAAVGLLVGLFSFVSSQTPIAYRNDALVPYLGATHNVDIGANTMSAAQFVGGGAGLTSVTGTDSTKLPLTGGTIAGNLAVTGTANFTVSFSTKAAAGAGALNALACPAGSYALSGGCSCSGAVGVTGEIDSLGPLTAGAMPTEYDCQQTGGTGGACAVSVLCSKIQF